MPRQATRTDRTPPDAKAISAEQRRLLREELDRAGLGARIAEIVPLVRDSIALVPRKARAADLAPGASRFGGAPDAPRAFERAAEPGFEVDFLGQLDLGAVAPWDIHGRLPHEGLLSFFLLRRGDEEIMGRVLHDRGAFDTKPAKTPARRKALAVDVGLRVVPPPYNSLGYPVTDVPYESFYDDLRDRGAGPLRVEGSGLLGHDRPDERMLRPDEELLLRLDTADGFDFDFAEAACLYFVISRAALAKHDFSTIRTVLGAG